MENRIIKFRAWNNSAQTMYQDVIVHGNNIVIAKYNIETDGEDPLIEPMTYTINSKFNWTLMQFTGLLDKNGKEIYEGDILQWTSSNPFSLGELRKVQVNYIQAQFWCNGSISVYLAELLANEKCEVIGNIHQNPNLI